MYLIFCLTVTVGFFKYYRYIPPYMEFDDKDYSKMEEAAFWSISTYQC